MVVSDYILQHIEELSREIRLGKHDSLYRMMFGRSLSEQDKKNIEAWCAHIEDDFFVVDHIPKKGTVFVQIGRIDKERINDGKIFDENDVHEPRVFLVRGLATPLAELVANLAADFKQHNPRMAEKYEGLPLARIHTVIVPFNGGLTYCSNMDEANQEHYRSQEELDKATRRAVKAIELLSTLLVDPRRHLRSTPVSIQSKISLWFDLLRTQKMH